MKKSKKQSRVTPVQKALLSPDAFDESPEQVELVETHISWVFLAGDYVYKVKKPVSLGFLDFSTLEKRLTACEAELRLNRRLCPDSYLAVVPINRDEDGVLKVDGPGATVDYAVKMQRFPANRMMNHLLDEGEMDDEILRAVAETLVRFHAEAATGAGVDEHGSLESITFNVEENFEQLKPFCEASEEGGLGAPLLSPAVFAHLRAWALAFLDAQRSLLESRIKGGKIREGHGDLHSGNICLPEGAGPLIYDCIEFNQRFRCGDVASDLAFLTMDLDFHGFHAFSRHLARIYQDASGDTELMALLPFYQCYRAIVRTKVAALRGSAPSASAQAKSAARSEAENYAQLAVSYALAPVLVLTCGLPGSGKTYVSKELLHPFEPLILRSDVIRKRELKKSAEESDSTAGVQDLYAPEAIAKTYAIVLEECREALGKGRSVIVDAAFSQRDQRAPFIDLARELGVPLCLIHLEVSGKTARKRLQLRRNQPHEASDADWNVYKEMRTRFESPSELPASQVINASSDDPAEINLQLVDRLVAIAEQDLG